MQIWRIPNDERDLGTPTVASGVLYVGDGVGLSARRVSDGALLWHAHAADAAPILTATSPLLKPSVYVAGTPVVANGQIFATVSVPYVRSSASVIVALDTQTGVTRWRYPPDDKLPGFVGSLVVGP